RLIASRVRNTSETLDGPAIELALLSIRSDNPAAVQAAIELSVFFSPGDTECLIALLDDPDAMVRTRAITVLASSPHARPSWVPRFVDLSLDPNQPDHVRVEARRAAILLSNRGPNVRD
ncbi:MAG: hypothetical protein K2Q20_11505, partial [Phycisphaerales bacterium]|nr:hypothetical protein [Phycisphaerales bacterium]